MPPREKLDIGAGVVDPVAEGVESAAEAQKTVKAEVVDKNAEITPMSVIGFVRDLVNGDGIWGRRLHGGIEIVKGSVVVGKGVVMAGKGLKVAGAGLDEMAAKARPSKKITVGLEAAGKGVQVTGKGLTQFGKGLERFVHGIDGSGQQMTPVRTSRGTPKKRSPRTRK